MKLRRRQFLRLSMGAAALPIVSRVARAQTYPSRPITMVVGFQAGGPTDTTARVVAERMRVSLGQTVIIENVAGASGSIAAGRVARAPPDGYVISFGSATTHVFNGAVYALPYDVLKDFEPVSLVASDPMMMVATKAMPAKDLKELIAWLKANPNQASQGRPRLQLPAAGACRRHEGPRRLGQKAPAIGARYPDRGRGRSARTIRFGLVCAFCPEGHPGERHRQAEYRCCGSLGRYERTRATRRSRAANFPPRAADPRNASRLPKCRDREMVADHQGGGHQT